MRGIGTRVWGCPRLCVWVGARWSWVSCSITAYFIPLRRGLLMNLEPSWQSVSPSNGLCPSQRWVHAHKYKLFLLVGNWTQVLLICSKCSYPLSPLSIPHDSFLLGLCYTYLISEAQAEELAKWSGSFSISETPFDLGGALISFLSNMSFRIAIKGLQRWFNG